MNYTLLEFDRLESTSDFLKEHYTYFPHMTFIRASYQSKGRGQFDRLWQSNADQNILCSILFKEMHVSKAPLIKLWVMESLIVFLHQLNIDAMFKEPNDIYVGKNKLCGILIESKSTEEQFDYVIIGFGLNVNQIQFEYTNATSLKMLLAKDIDLDDVFSACLKHMVNAYEKYDL